MFLYPDYLVTIWSYGDQNEQTLINLSSTITGILAPTLSTDQISIEIRVYYNSSAGFASADSNLTSLANSVLSWIKNPSTSSNGSIIPDNTAPTGLDYSRVSVVPVDIADITGQLKSSPSSAAWSTAGNLVSTGSSFLGVSLPTSPNGPSAAQQNQMLFTNVIDIWATFKNPTTGTTQLTNNQNPQTDQSSIAQTQQFINSFNQSLGLNK